MAVLEQLVNASGKPVKVWSIDGNYCVCLEGAYLYEDLGGADKQLYNFGIGATIERAAQDYLSQISGKTLGFDHSDKKWNVLAIVVSDSNNCACKHNEGEPKF